MADEVLLYAACSIDTVLNAFSARGKERAYRRRPLPYSSATAQLMPRNPAKRVPPSQG